MNEIYRVRSGRGTLADLRVCQVTGKDVIQSLQHHYTDRFSDPEKCGLPAYLRDINACINVEYRLCVLYDVSFDDMLCQLWKVAVQPFLPSLFRILYDHCDDDYVVSNLRRIKLCRNFPRLYARIVVHRLLQYHAAGASVHFLHAFFLRCFFVSKNSRTLNVAVSHLYKTLFHCK